MAWVSHNRDTASPAFPPLPLEVVREFLPVTGVMQLTVDVLEDRPLVDLLILVVSAELIECLVGNIRGGKLQFRFCLCLRLYDVENGRFYARNWLRA